MFMMSPKENLLQHIYELPQQSLIIFCLLNFLLLNTRGVIMTSKYQ